MIDYFEFSQAKIHKEHLPKNTFLIIEILLYINFFLK